jgi:O-antigen/teichoic acid export membrane protein
MSVASATAAFGGQATAGSLVRLGAELASRALSLAASFVIAVGLGVEGFGVFAAALGAALVIAELADLGLHGTASRALVAGTLPLATLARARALATVPVVALALALSLAGEAVAGALSGSPAAPRWLAQAAPLLAPLLLYATLSGAVEWLGVVLRASDRRGQEAALLLSSRALALAAVALALASSPSPPAARLAWALCCSAPLPLVLGVALVARAARRRASAAGARQRGGAAAASVLGVLRQALPLAVNGVLALVAIRVELVLLLALRGPREAGLFAAALKAVESLGGVPAAISGGAMPALTREALTGGSGARRRTATLVALVAVPAAAALALLAPQLAGLLGEGYAEAVAPLRLIAAALVATFMNALLLHALIAAGRAAWLPRLTALRLGLALVTAAPLVLAFGAVGGALGFLASELVLLLAASRACAAARFEVPVVRSLGRALPAVLPMAALLALLRPALPLAVPLGLACYAATLALAWPPGGRVRDLARPDAWRRA